MVEVEVKRCVGRSKVQGYKIIHFIYCMRDEFLTAVKLLCKTTVQRPLPVSPMDKFVANTIDYLHSISHNSGVAKEHTLTKIH